MAEKIIYTEAELKKLEKDKLVDIANKEFGLNVISQDTTIPKLIPMILDAQAKKDQGDQPGGADQGANATSEASTPPATTPPAPEPTTPHKEETPTPPAQEPEPTLADDPNLISVRSTAREPDGSGGWKQAFRERHPDHPDGEAWIANGKVHKVAHTAAVKKAVLDGTIEIVS